MTAVVSSPTRSRRTALGEIGDELRVLVVAGVPVGVLVAGVGSRLAMMLLRVTSGDDVVGVTSDDGFRVGQTTLAGTYNLLLLGAVVGVLGAAVYQWVAPFLLGPRWFRHVTVGLGCAAVVGSMLVHADGVDFTLLDPTWLAISLFVVLPGVFGVLIGVVVDRVDMPASWTARGRRRWLLPLALLVPFPLVVVFPLAFAAVVVAVWVLVRDAARERLADRGRVATVWMNAARIGWLVVAVAGLRALVLDVDAIA